jgi:long-chain acyl-CoA synthetase
MSLAFAVRRAAQVCKDGTAVIDGSHRIVWPELEVRIAAIAGQLRAMGLQRGERIAILALNSSMYFELLLATWWCGAVIVPLNTRLAPDELRYILNHAEIKLFLADEELANLARSAGGAACSPTVLHESMYRTLLGGTAIDPITPSYEDTAGIFYTGGTTGLPKGVELSHRNFAFAAAGMLRDLSLGPTSVYLHAAPMFHLADFGIGLGVTMGAGTHSFLTKFTPQDVYQRLQDDGITHLNLVPTMLAAVLDAHCRDDQLLAQVRHISYGAAPITPAQLERVLEGFPNAAINQFYGMTESCGASVFLGPERHVVDGSRSGKLKSAGQVIPGFELRIADEAGRDVPEGAVGEILVRGPAVMKGYWKDPIQTAKTLANGWLHSGDCGYLDADGFLYVVDRIKDMIISGGENVYCSEVENALASHDSVQACAAVGLPDDKWGERVHAVIIRKPGCDISAEELDTHVRSRLAGYKAPKSYEFADSLPLSAVGKVQKKVLRERCLQRIEKNHE